MKKTILLIIIYLAFISLGLPDSILGAGWPIMYHDLNASIFSAGIISMIVASGSVISSIYSARLIDKFGTSNITLYSVLSTAIALLGFSYSTNFISLCFWAVPLGLGAGCIDSALNNYVALHYKALHMNWLHSFWGVGASIGPIIMAHYIAQEASWNEGFKTVGLIQLGLVIVLFISIPLWIINKIKGKENLNSQHIPIKGVLNIPGIKQSLLICFCYCTIEASFGLWGSSYLVLQRGISPELGARLISLYYIGITSGRFLSGIISTRISNKHLIYIGQSFILLGLSTLYISFQGSIFISFLFIGVGCAPIFPSLLHDTPVNFGKDNSQTIMGIQMASAYTGTTLMPMILGVLASYFSYEIVPIFILLFLVIMFIMTILLNSRIRI